jgi:hypothetical protein
MGLESYRSYLALCDGPGPEGKGRGWCPNHNESSEKMHHTLKDFQAELRRIGWIIRRDGSSICPRCS